MLRWPDTSLYGALSDIASERPDTTAVVFDEAEITYRELLARSRAFAAGLAERDITRGDRIAVWLANRPEWLYAQLGASYLGVAVVAVNTRYRTHELEYMLTDSEAKALVLEESFLGRDYLEMVAEIVPDLRDDDPNVFDSEALPALEHVVSVDPVDDFSAVYSFEEFSGPTTAKTDTEVKTEYETPVDDGSTPVCIFYTSGTTGDPKGCVHDSRAVLNHSYNIGTHLGIDDTDTGLGAIPFCGAFGYNVWLSCLSHGVTLVVQSHFDPETAVDLIDRHEVTYFSATAQMYLRMIDVEDATPERLASLRRGVLFFANGFDEADFERIETHAGFPVVQPYGLSEANTQIFTGDPGARKAQRKRVGGPLIHEELEARIVDPDTGERLSAGERGELLLAGYNVMQEYLDKPEATAEAIDTDGWLHTGDLCERDESGTLYFHSRLGDALRVRGFLVSPREIETAIDAHEAVSLSQVVGAPHSRHGQVPVAFVKSTEPLESDDLLAFLEERVADYKVPQAVEFVDEFPRTEGPHGAKIQRHVLEEQVADRYT
jgi:fatty-acyl-CoA synthase